MLCLLSAGFTGSLWDKRPDSRGLVSLNGGFTTSGPKPSNMFIKLMKPLMKHFRDGRNISVLIIMKDGSQIRYCQVTPSLSIWIPYADYHTGEKVGAKTFNEKHIRKIRRVVHNGNRLNDGITVYHRAGDIVDAWLTFIEIPSGLAGLTAEQMYESVRKDSDLQKRLDESIETSIWINKQKITNMRIVLKTNDKFEIRYKYIVKRDY